MVPCDPNFLCISIKGSGHATHLGKISESANFAIDLANPPKPGCNNSTGTLTLTGANGDSISLALRDNFLVTMKSAISTSSSAYGRRSAHHGHGGPAAHAQTAEPGAITHRLRELHRHRGSATITGV